MYREVLITVGLKILRLNHTMPPIVRGYGSRGVVNWHKKEKGADFYRQPLFCSIIYANYS
jgi:hypothetical protein